MKRPGNTCAKTIAPVTLNIEHWGEAEQKAAEKVYLLLHKQSKQALTGKSEQLQPGTFW
ncbi:hypothetical protein B0F87_10460 [Methylobacter tundripaludum]|uniref:Uncharacterized protein n=1 Tax=Methylobacter tundripaludum TaxID=173365 RepID=A0A2S6HEV2_9GAMM|nr:hypothetical protein B0F87_10460 [Methylobacter tundripaludum]